MTLRDAGNYDRKAESDRTAIAPGGPSLTVQAQAEDADINVLMKRFGVTGQFPTDPRAPMYGDFSEITDFRSALLAVRRAEEAFMEYPADFRARFENNPQLFLDFVENPGNIEALKQLGLTNVRPSRATASPDGAPGGASTAAASGAPTGNSGTPPANAGGG